MEKLYNKIEDCCGCGACENVCPKNAISMKEDEYGFIFPVIDDKLCVNCRMCRNVCAFQNITENNSPLKTWVAVSKNKEGLKKSASGGVFYTLANAVIKENGCAAGAAFDDKFELSHIIAYDEKTLEKLQGSKYTQSSTGYVFREIKKQLLEGKKVLFCGTPCQVAGLRSFLEKKYDRLITIDLICHGIPSNKMFKDYIHYFETEKSIKVDQFMFRDKKIGWGKNGSVIANSGKRYRLFESAQSYFFLFANSMIMRSNCYSCKYACSHRPGDLTIGDFWGIQREHPELLKNEKINEAKGISVIIANTEKGTRFIQEHRDLFDLYDSTFEKAARGNAQLKVPTKYNPKRDSILELYRNNGWQAVEKAFHKKIGLRRYSGYIKMLVPKELKRLIKMYLK